MFMCVNVLWSGVQSRGEGIRRRHVRERLVRVLVALDRAHQLERGHLLERGRLARIESEATADHLRKAAAPILWWGTTACTPPRAHHQRRGDRRGAVPVWRG
eukprot:3281266-Prymnesium_polylepis.3